LQIKECDPRGPDGARQIGGYAVPCEAGLTNRDKIAMSRNANARWLPENAPRLNADGPWLGENAP
jgi:hypothetical protein